FIIPKTDNSIKRIDFFLLKKKINIGGISGEKRLWRAFQRNKSMVLQTSVDGQKVFLIILFSPKFFFYIFDKSGRYFFISSDDKSIYQPFLILHYSKFYLLFSVLFSQIFRLNSAERKTLINIFFVDFFF